MHVILAADALVLLHGLFILFVVCGGALVLKWPKLVLLHIPCAIWGAGIEFLGGICPLTPLEQQLRSSAGAAGYTGGFIEHYLLPVIYPAGLTPGIQILLGLVVVLVNLVFYGLVIRRMHRR